jgi:phosphoribosylaminoimidazole-succinocarboxamide synthase
MSLVHTYTGKVRDLYEAGPEHYLMVASDRVSAFDVVLDQPIPHKGRVLTALTVFWLERLAELAPNHLVSADPADFPRGAWELGDVAGRAMLVRRAEMLPVECIVRGRLAGSAWREYRDTGTVHGETVPVGLLESDPLPQPTFTPSTKADVGHDVNIDYDDAVSIVGADVARGARDLCLAAFELGASWAAERGIVIADTKFELGFIKGELALCDEVLTPDSSRFWPKDEVHRGTTPPSFDKQPIRDWLESTGWDKTPPAPALPDEIVLATSDRYVQAYETLSGRSLSDWYGPEPSS